MARRATPLGCLSAFLLPARPTPYAGSFTFLSLLSLFPLFRGSALVTSPPLPLRVCVRWAPLRPLELAIVPGPFGAGASAPRTRLAFPWNASCAVSNHASTAVVLRHYLDPLMPPTPAARILFNRLVPAPRALPVPVSPVAFPVGYARVPLAHSAAASRLGISVNTVRR
jgi:hypothetical protein